MPDFFDKLREQIDAGLTKVTTKSRVTIETTRLRTQMRGIAKEKEEALARLGTRVYQEMSRDGQVNQEGVQQDVKRIQEMDRSIENLQKEIDRLEALDAATPWSTAGGAEKPIATCTCGTPLTEGTKFCGNCGAEVSVAAKFCRSCGAALTGGQETTARPQSKPSCLYCGSEISSAARFCKSCGKAVVSETSPAKTEETEGVEASAPKGLEEQAAESLPGPPEAKES